MFGKIEIRGKIKLNTGMHIGGESEFSAIGGIDAPVMRDKLTDLPFIPGSSFKGKMRYLLASKYTDQEIKINAKHNDDDPKVLRLFGASNDGKDNKSPIKSRLYFSDSFISNKDELFDRGIDSITEVKFENTIDRFTAVANPRQIERVIRGVEFDFSIIYNIINKEDIGLVKEGLELLKYDYIGGNGSRGYGRIDFIDLELNPLVGEMDDELIKELIEIIR
ncbi:MAG: type III-A CRISPR-associated RAMP protein Csm3 [Tissierellia bacterium]|nr:type III-A CRISPR-associated RAMP protein Csm3 [Tissierellia bacterium]